MSATPDEAAAIKDACTRASDAVFAATQANWADPVAWWSRIADAEDAYADALHAAAGLYFEPDPFAYNVLISLSHEVRRSATRNRRKAEHIAAKSGDLLSPGELGGAG